MKKIVYWTALVAFAGCTTVEFVRKDLAPTKQAVVRYAPASSEKSRSKYLQEVDKQARNFCEGNYQITKEYQARDETGASSGVGTGVGMGMGGIFVGGSHRNSAMYNFVEFTCQ